MRWDLARSSEISLDLDEISLDLLDKSPKYENLLLESGNLKSESGNLRPESGKYRRNLENLAGFWKFLPDSGNFCWIFLAHRSDRVFSDFGEENRDRSAGVGFWNKWPAADRWLNRIGRFSGRFRSESSGGSDLRIGWTPLFSRPSYLFLTYF